MQTKIHTKKLSVLVLFYSFTGKTAELAKIIAQGAREIGDVEVKVMRVPELLPASFFRKNPKLKKVHNSLTKEFPEASLDDFINADGVALGTPVHFGSFASQLKQFLDGLSPIWLEGKLVNKPAAVFCSGGSIHSGEEATLLSLIIPLLNLGMIPVGIPYPVQGEGVDFDAGSPYGGIFVSGHRGEKKLSQGDKKVARLLGRRLASMTNFLNCSCEGCLRYDFRKKER
ncbi:MAG: NAD(P)H:quinone oxidoreductase [Candidatus Nomurabacteria bacterium]|nr:MAG: NAD(P)H:quinone oxidoreductase [Candidatus Nomurabacteria bacterium]